MIDKFTIIVAEIFGVIKHDVVVVNRTRQGKISLHIRVRGKIINKNELGLIAQYMTTTSIRKYEIKINTKADEIRENPEKLSKAEKLIKRYKDIQKEKLDKLEQEMTGKVIEDLDDLAADDAIEQKDDGNIRLIDPIKGIYEISLETYKTEIMAKVGKALCKSLQCKCKNYPGLCLAQQYMIGTKSLFKEIDLCVYGTNSQLRFTSEECRFDKRNNIVKILSEESRKLVENRKNQSDKKNLARGDIDILRKVSEVDSTYVDSKPDKVYVKSNERRIYVTVKNPPMICNQCKRVHD
jgi:hypothetical protein